MSYKLGLLLSALFVMATFLLGTDLMLVNAVYQSVDALATTVGHRISMEGYISHATMDFVLDHGCEIECLSDSEFNTPIGETFVYRIYREYQPIILKDSAMRISVTRSCVVGFYRPLS